MHRYPWSKVMESLLKRLINKKEHLNEVYIEVLKKDFKDACMYQYQNGESLLRTMFASDEREIDGTFKIYSVFSVPGKDEFIIIYTSVSGDNLSFPSITTNIPAAHWYEREIRDMFGLIPEGHPDPRRLVLHDSFPIGSHPLRRDWSAKESDLREWGEGIIVKHPYNFMEVEGEGITEIPVGPVHAGIIEPGHFRFSAIGETVIFLEPRLFYTHKGTEKHFERLGFFEGVKLAERVSGTSSFSHSAAYCMAVERMASIVLTEKAEAVRTLFLELERLYNHIGDIGNMCAGSGLAVGYAKGAVIKERLMQLNEMLTGNRYLRGINTIVGVNRDAFL
ncbi:MAG: hypothetical protein E4H45_02740 [Nitrospirales bacterium]|nr:MAG: hypothetical protein E4H45_02740 [Nitrospirales bacterium]